MKATLPAESFHELNEQSTASMTHIIIFHVSSNHKCTTSGRNKGPSFILAVNNYCGKVMCICLGPSHDPADRIGDREVKWVDRFVGEEDGGGVQNVRRK